MHIIRMLTDAGPDLEDEKRDDEKDNKDTWAKGKNVVLT